MSQPPHLAGGWSAREEDLEPPQGLESDEERLRREDRLVDEDRHPDGDRLDRMLGDADLLLNLQLSNYSPKVWKPIAEEFARYGYAVISSWIRRGLIFGIVTKATNYGFTRDFDERIQGREDVHDLASFTVVNALDKFLEIALKNHSWDPNKGASLKTYFIGQCKWQFPNVYKEWRRTQKRRPPSDSLDDLVERNVFAPAHNNVEASFDREAEVTETLGRIESAEAQSALIYQAEGYSYAEIAVFLKLDSAKTVENLVTRWKARIRGTTPTSGRRQSA
ncbi:RNA polymerase sigma factor [Blastococcus litoris]|uniref:RNA polymerase sigma factor n=1 Tax=Blastococcus litoris TaxID=2171622 RepID=UPI000E308464|nr:hypothetical protein [Blastococcus litoris]